MVFSLQPAILFVPSNEIEATCDGLLLSRLWNVFSKSNELVHDGPRLENITWRLWRYHLVNSTGCITSKMRSHGTSASRIMSILERATQDAENAIENIQHPPSTLKSTSRGAPELALPINSSGSPVSPSLPILPGSLLPTSPTTTKKGAAMKGFGRQFVAKVGLGKGGGFAHRRSRREHHKLELPVASVHVGKPGTQPKHCESAELSADLIERARTTEVKGVQHATGPVIIFQKLPRDAYSSSQKTRGGLLSLARPPSLAGAILGPSSSTAMSRLTAGDGRAVHHSGGRRVPEGVEFDSSESDSGSARNRVPMARSLAEEKLEEIFKHRGALYNKLRSSPSDQALIADTPHPPSRAPTPSPAFPPISSVRDAEIHVGIPTSPQTTRRQFVNAEFSESVRHSVLRHRKLGIGIPVTAQQAGKVPMRLPARQLVARASGVMEDQYIGIKTQASAQEVATKEDRKRATFAQLRGWEGDYHYSGW